ncbi:viral A-type inclusion protein [Reticulomyxa filosa]|uniref:Viral A-type inclusion protein n=1 Tax=Reticulomyxa filosa TaxID=46433 RepID=X6N754_RETFI|nr:viral A-type inclusion protein [Reticulomyxa filosa]|eukprot:ETO22110.1 viral A-type inclusion protein [Reticulomyxa filosa]
MQSTYLKGNNEIVEKTDQHKEEPNEEKKAVSDSVQDKVFLELQKQLELHQVLLESLSEKIRLLQLDHQILLENKKDQNSKTDQLPDSSKTPDLANNTSDKALQKGSKTNNPDPPKDLLTEVPVSESRSLQQMKEENDKIQNLTSAKDLQEESNLVKRFLPQVKTSSLSNLTPAEEKDFKNTLQTYKTWIVNNTNDISFLKQQFLELSPGTVPPLKSSDENIQKPVKRLSNHISTKQPVLNKFVIHENALKDLQNKINQKADRSYVDQLMRSAYTSRENALLSGKMLEGQKCISCDRPAQVIPWVQSQYTPPAFNAHIRPKSSWSKSNSTGTYFLPTIVNNAESKASTMRTPEKERLLSPELILSSLGDKNHKSSHNLAYFEFPFLASFFLY